MRSSRSRRESTSRRTARHGRMQIYKVLKKSEIPARAFPRLVVFYALGQVLSKI